MHHLIRAEGMEVNTGCCLVHGPDDLFIGLHRKAGMDSGEQADLRDIAGPREGNLLFDHLNIVAESPFIPFIPAEPAEPAEVLADVRQVDVLVSDIGDHGSCPLLSDGICK